MYICVLISYPILSCFVRTEIAPTAKTKRTIGRRHNASQ